jgi:DNA (cytosine-5)-methyltransferase 1
MNREQSKNLTMISLFSGAMGLDLGLEKAGFQVRLAVEINPAAVKTIHLNRPTLPVLTKSIANLTSQEILEAAGLGVGETTLISGGPCCQSFSTAGNRESLEDPRGNLFFDFCRVVREAQPRFFVMENVRGILSAAVRHRPLNRRGPGFPPLQREERLGSALQKVIQEFEALNYYVAFSLVNCADYGVPQKRWRVVFLGSRDGEAIGIPQPTHQSPECTGHLPHWVTLRDALAGVRSKNWINFGTERKRLLSGIPPGKNWRALSSRLQKKALGAAFDSWGGRSGFCRKLDWKKPAPTLTTAPDGRATMLCHPSKPRPLSIEEYAALQQFPKDWQFFGTLRQKYTQIGNAVPLGLGYAIGSRFRDLLRRPKKADPSLCGKVICADAVLATSLANRRITMLNPPHMRRYQSAETARRWLAASGK